MQKLPKAYEDLLISNAPKAYDYLCSLPSTATQYNYAKKLNLLYPEFKGLDSLLTKAKQKSSQDDPDSLTLADIELRRWFVQNKGLSIFTRSNTKFALKSFLEYYNLAHTVNWKIISRTIGHVNHIAKDRPPTKPEIRQLLSILSRRNKAIVLFMLSGSFRVGGFDKLKMSDFKIVEFGNHRLGRLTIYGGEGEEYWTLVSPEALKAFEEYLEERMQLGEKITLQSPMFRRELPHNFFTKARKTRWLEKQKNVKMPRGITEQAIEHFMIRKWVESGVRQPEDKTRANGQRYAFSACHSLRKFFGTHFLANCEQHGDVDREILMGHFRNYQKPTDEHLYAEYARSLRNLTISEVDEVRFQSEEEKKALEGKYEHLERRLDEVLAHLASGAQVQNESRTSNEPNTQGLGRNEGTLPNRFDSYQTTLSI